MKYLPCWLQIWPSETRSQGHKQPEGSEEGIPTAPQTKGEGQQGTSEIPKYGRNKHGPGSGMATGQTWAAGWRQADVWIVRSSRTSSPKTPSLCPLRFTNASYQYQAGGWNALELPSHGNHCAAGTYLPPLPKIPSDRPRRAMGPSMCSTVVGSCFGAALGHWSAAGRAPVGYQGTARSSAVLAGQLGSVEEGWRSSQWDSQVLSGQILLQTTTKGRL